MIKYRGGKSKEIPNIMWHIPRFTGRYIEPFFGGGALFFYLEPRRAVINDINTKLMGFYRGVRDDYANLRQELDKIEMARQLDGVYRLDHAVTAKQKTILKAFGLTDTNVNYRAQEISRHLGTGI